MLNMAFGSTALRITTLVFLFIARIRFPASDSLIGVLRKTYVRDLVNKMTFIVIVIVLNLIKLKIKENKEIKVKKNVKKISA